MYVCFYVCMSFDDGLGGLGSIGCQRGRVDGVFVVGLCILVCWRGEVR